MTLGMITVVILAVSAALCAVATVSFYRSNVFNDKKKKLSDSDNGNRSDHVECVADRIQHFHEGGFL